MVLIVSGPLCNDEVDRAYAEAFASPEFVPGLDTLIDIRAASTNPTPSELRERARRSAEMTRSLSGHVALVFATNDVQYGMGRMYTVFAQERGLNAEVFTDLAEAQTWLASLRNRTRG
jgi:hypothetical protein